MSRIMMQRRSVLPCFRVLLLQAVISEGEVRDILFHHSRPLMFTCGEGDCVQRLRMVSADLLAYRRHCECVERRRGVFPFANER